MAAATAERPGYLETLNPAQAEAAAYGRTTATGVDSGPLLVIAGAGTGKTMALAHRVAHLVMQGTRPERILLLTFSRRAAQEMTRRVDAILRRTLAAGNGESPSAPLTWAGTFHSVANRLLRRYAANVGLDPAFSVLDRGDSADLLDVVRHDLDLSRRQRRFPKKDTCFAIYSRCVNTGTSLPDNLRAAFPWCSEWEDELRQLFRGYVEQKQTNQVLDYDDLLLYWHHLVAVPELAAEIGACFDHVLVDEYQDTNRLQASILDALKPDGKGVTVVGDDAQSIYSFRAADVANILGFAARYSPAAHVVTLTQNYRSSQPILDSANRLIGDSDVQYPKNLVSTRPAGAKPIYMTVDDGNEEADFVVETILGEREAGTLLKDQAVLFRSAHHSDRLEVELVRRNIPYVKYGGLKFLEAAHVKDLLAVLKWAENPYNRVAAFRVLKLLPGIGPAYADRCLEHLAAHAHDLRALADHRPPGPAATDWAAFVELLTALHDAELDDECWQHQVQRARQWYTPHLERLYESADVRKADLEQLERIATQFPTRERFLTELTLDPPSGSGDRAGDPLLDEDYLVLSTVHSAKGQEWKAVYVLNVTDGNFPSEFATGKPEQIEEERRLLYVAMTRAKESLYLLAPFRFHVTQQARHGDRHVYGARSRFVTDALLETFEQRAYRSKHAGRTGPLPRVDTRVDVAAKLRDMW